MAATRRRGDPRRRRAAGRARRSARAGPCGDRSPARTWSAGPTSARSTWSSGRPDRDATARTSWSPPTTSPPRTAPGWCTSPPPSARTTSRSCRAYGLPVVNPVDAGRALRGRRAAGRRAVLQERRQPPGRRPDRRAACCSGTCPTSTATRTAGAATRALLYYAQPSWYIRTTADQGRAARARTRTTNWYPETIKHGRYGDWLNNNIDWALSRSRYWGTPLPIWRCADDHQVCVGSLAELGELTGPDLSGLDPHRPYVDDVTFAVPDLRRGGAPGARGHRRAGTTPARCRSRSGATRTPRARASCSSRPTRPSSSARRSTRPAAGSTR